MTQRLSRIWFGLSLALLLHTFGVSPSYGIVYTRPTGGGGGGAGTVSLVDQMLQAKTNGAVKITGNLGLQYTNGITMNGVIFESFDITNDNLFIGQAAGGLFNYQNAMGAPPVGGGIQPFIPSHITGMDNIGFGFGALQDMQDGRENIGMGIEAAWQVSHGSFNVAIGGSMGNECTSASNNVVIGTESGGYSDAQGTISIGAWNQQNQTGSYTNIVIGTSAADNWNANESFNIIIGDNQGVAGESGNTRIGTEGEQQNAYLAGLFHPSTNGTVIGFLPSAGSGIPTNKIPAYLTTATNWWIGSYKGGIAAIATNLTGGATPFIIKQLAP